MLELVYAHKINFTNAQKIFQIFFTYIIFLDEKYINKINLVQIKNIILFVYLFIIFRTIKFFLKIIIKLLG